MVLRVKKYLKVIYLGPHLTPHLRRTPKRTHSRSERVRSKNKTTSPKGGLCYSGPGFYYSVQVLYPFKSSVKL